MNGCESACPTSIRRRGWICSIFRIKSSASGGTFGNWTLSGVGGLLGSLRMKRLALSDVTKSRSASESFPSFSQMIVSCCDKRFDQR